MSLTMTPVDAPSPHKRFRRSTTSDAIKTTYTSDQGARSSRSASTSSYPYSSRRSSTSGSNSLTHSNCSHSHSSISHTPPAASSSRSRSAAEARAFVLDPAYSGVGRTQARVFVDERGVAHDSDYRMFPTVPSSPPRSNMVRRGSMTSARGTRYPNGSVGGCSDSPLGPSPFAGSPFAGYADFATHYSNSAGHEEDSDEEVEERMDIDEDAESEIEWSRLHASPPVYGSQEGGQRTGEKVEEDGYADFVGMEWDEKEWRREEVVPALDKHDPSTAKGKHAAAPGSAPSIKSYPKPKSKTRTKSKSKTESVSSVRGYVPAKRSYDESGQDEWTPSCGYSVRRHWQSLTLRIRFSVFRWRRRLRRVLSAATSTSSSGPSVEQRT